MESAGLSDTNVTGYDVGFKLAPRINASGRMGHARLAVELLTRADADRSREIAMYLEEHNRSRQTTERRILKQALAMIEERDLASDARRAIVLAMDGWHAGVIGIVAARIVDRYHRPTVMIALADGVGQGSGRSIQHFDLADALAACEEELISYGGHAMAAGLRIAEDRVAAFTERLVALANHRLTGDDLVPKLRLDAEVTLNTLDLPTAQAIDEIGPFGVGNPKPRLATGWVELADEPRCVGRNQEHLQASFVQQGVRVRAIGFGLASAAEDLKQHRRCQVAFAPIINEFNGRRSVEMQMLDLRFPG
jgi:single-stranded-DNA-specific exonuclease